MPQIPNATRPIINKYIIIYIFLQRYENN
jgi:hypothetical protein